MPQSYSEGQRLQGSDGNIYVVHNGTPVLESTAPRTFGTPDPTQPLKVPEAQAKIDNTTTDTATARAKLPYVAPLDAAALQEAEAKAQYAKQLAAATAAEAAAKADLAKSQAAMGAQPQSSQLQKQAQIRGALNLLDNLDKQESLWRDKYVNNGPLDTMGRMLPTPTNRNFDQFSKNELVSGKAFLRVPGEGSSSDRDVTNYTDLLPQSNSFDATNINRFQNLREQANAILRDAGLPQRPSNVLTPDGRVYVGARDAQGRPAAGGILAVNGGSPPAPGGGGTPPAGPTGPQSNPLNYAQGQYGDATSTEVAGATKSIPNELGIQFMNGLNSLFHVGAPDEKIRAYASQFGIDPSAQLDYRRKNPGFRGSIPVTPGGLSITVPNDSAMSRAAGAMAGSPTGTFVGEAGNAAAAGIPQWAAGQLSDNPDLVRARFGVARSMNPGAAIGGELVGGTIGAIGGETGALRAAGALGKALKVGEGAQDVLNFGGRRLGDAIYGGISGATSAQPGQAGSGAIKGALAGVGGGLLGEGVGRYAIEPVTRPIGRLFGAPMAPSTADNALLKAVGNNGPDINAQLGEAQTLGLPMTLADTNPALRSLTGAAVRRSPDASGIAENVLLPRNRGQIDRFGAAVNRDLGPVGNVPQTSLDLQTAARTKAGPLYDQAYAAPPINDPELTALLNNPQMKSAFDAAKMFREQDATLAAARGEPVPPPLGDPSAPDIRTLDYIKRGLDGKIRTAFTGGDPQAAMSGPFYKDARNILLTKADTAVPAYEQARLSYGGPMRALDAMEAGQKAVRPGMTADQLGVDLGKIGEGDIPQIQLGYRSGLMDQANNVRTSGNPYEATLGTPNSEAKLSTVFPDNPNISRLLRQRDLERQMQATSNDILGNSKTAQRGIADQDFMNKANWAPTAIDAAISMKTGSLPIGPIAKIARAAADARKMGLGKKRADILTPTLLNPDPAAASAELSDILARSEGYRNYLSRRRGVFGAPMGGVGAGSLSGYLSSQ